MPSFDEQLELIRKGYGVEGSAMDVIPSLLRGAFRAPEGQQFVASDYSQIELRVLAWLTGCAKMLNLFHRDLDPYLDFAARLYNVAYDTLTKKSPERQIAKPAVLACGFGTGGGDWIDDVRRCTSCRGKGCDNCELGYIIDRVKSGLWGYAESMGVRITRDEAYAMVKAYRTAYPDVLNYWRDCEEVIRGMLKNPHNEPEQFGVLEFELFPGKLLRVQLPSGRHLHYLYPEIDSDGRVSCDTEDGRRWLYGSLFTENFVQAIARDVMATGMIRAHEAGFKIVGHTHDEIITLCTLDTLHNLTYLNSVMVDEIDWCKDLPLKADGWEGPVYRK